MQEYLVLRRRQCIVGGGAFTSFLFVASQCVGLRMSPLALSGGMCSLLSSLEEETGRQSDVIFLRKFSVGLS